MITSYEISVPLDISPIPIELFYPEIICHVRMFVCF